jgi:hypothetical protein
MYQGIEERLGKVCCVMSGICMDKIVCYSSHGIHCRWIYGYRVLALKILFFFWVKDSAIDVDIYATEHIKLIARICLV